MASAGSSQPVLSVAARNFAECRLVTAGGRVDRTASVRAAVRGIGGMTGVVFRSSLLGTLRTASAIRGDVLAHTSPAAEAFSG